MAGRATLGLGKRITGQSAAEVSAELQARTAEQLFAVLGELKGGAMKIGQALSVFEAALPEETRSPYREALTKLQDAAPPMPAETVHRVLAEQFGRRWPDRFQDFDEVPAAAASIGQVHRAVWSDGREVAVKLQYPGADAGADGRLHPALADGLAVRRSPPAWRSSRCWPSSRSGCSRSSTTGSRPTRSGASPPRTRATRRSRFRGSWPARRRPSSASGWTARRCPRSSPRHPGGARPRRLLLALLHYSAPARAGMLHADPHPGNFRMLAGRPARRGRLRRRGPAARRLSPAAGPADPARRRRTTPTAVLDLCADRFVRPG